MSSIFTDIVFILHIVKKSRQLQNLTKKSKNRHQSNGGVFSITASLYITLGNRRLLF